MAVLRTQSNKTQNWLLYTLLAALAWLLATRPIEQILLVSCLAVGGLLLVRWPWLAWLGLAATLPFAGTFSIGPLSGMDLMLGLAIVLWFLDGVRQRSLTIDWYLPPALTLIFIGALLLSMLGAVDLGEGIKEVVKWIEFALVLLLVRSSLRPAQTQWLVAALLLGGIGQAVLGLYQFFFRIGPEWFIVLGGYMRASGSFSQPNPYAGYLGLCLPVAVSLAIWSIGNLLGSRRDIEYEKSTHVPWWDLVGSYGLAGKIVVATFYTMSASLIGVGLLASWSRGGWLGALAGVGVVIIFRSRRMILISTAALLTLLAAVLLGSLSSLALPTPLVERLHDLPAYIGIGDVLSQPVTDENFSVIERIAHWVAALRMWEMAPWLGVGPGSYEAVYPLVRLPRWEEALGHAHNVYLNVLGETGIIGFTAFLILWIGIFAWTLGCLRRHKSGTWQMALSLGVLGILTHLAVHNTFDNLFVHGIYLHVGLWLACLGILKTKKNRSR